MPEFIRYVLWELKNSFGLVLLTDVVAVAVISVVYLIHKRKFKGETRFPWGKVFLWMVFLGYMIIVIYATMLRWAGFFHREWNLHLFRAWREAWNNFSAKNWANVLLNIAMFVPLGFLLPLLGKRFRKWYLTIPVGFGASLAIELFQLALGRGICDVDDLFCNALGATIGYFAVMATLALFNEKGNRTKPFWRFACLMLVPILAISGVFAAYGIKEYGNLPETAAYRVNLNHLQWNLEFELPESAEPVPVYRAQTMRKADCDAFAEEMASIMGQQVEMVSYYQEMAYYNLSRGIMSVYYHDGSYEFFDGSSAFGGFDHDVTQWDEANRETVENALKAYPVTVPEAAEFVSEGDGWYSFVCDRCLDGAVMLDGTLRVRYGVDDLVGRIDNKLVRYTHYKDTAVISPAQAYEKVKSGAFFYAEALKQHASDAVSVLSCELDYRIDTKGFYQPVYIFEISIPETGNTCTAMIPAIQ